jgi:drug/metabolite transporter (DMT)-like permease
VTTTALTRGPAGASLATAGLTALTLVLFAANSLLCRAALAGEHADAASFTAVRLGSGAAVLAVLARRRPWPPRGERAAPWRLALALFAYAIAFSLAYRRITAGTGALLLFAAVQLTMIGAGWRRGERPRALEWAGLAAAAAGLVVLTGPGLARPDAPGALLMLAAGAAWGVYSLAGLGRGDPLARNAASFVRATPMALLALAPAAVAGAVRLDAAGAALALASGALASGGGYTAWYAALRGLSPSRAAIVQLAVPPLAAAGAVLALGERVGVRLVLASLLVLGGIALAFAARRR